MDLDRIKYLYNRYQSANLSADEEKQWQDVLTDLSKDKELFSLLDSEWSRSDLSAPEFTEAEKDFIFQSIVSEPQQIRPVKERQLWPKISIAAAVAVIVFGAGLFFYKNSLKKEDEVTAYQNDIAPGKNGATLTLASGKKIYINDALAGNIASEAGVKISKTKDGQIIYEVTGDGQGGITYNTLTTTRGEQTHVRLPDGSLVFLNAESSLKYPTRFSGAEKRLISLTGEGYFEVAKDRAHPFIVEGAGQTVEVLGTHFNINAYGNNGQIRTTLIEGSVKVSGSGSGRTQVLKPGEQSRLNGDGISVAKVETDDVIAWKQGIFQYDGETLENIMKDVARWYNVEVVFTDASLKGELIYITANRYAKVSELLRPLGKMAGISFEIEGKTIRVHKK